MSSPTCSAIRPLWPRQRQPRPESDRRPHAARGLLGELRQHRGGSSAGAGTISSSITRSITASTATATSPTCSPTAAGCARYLPASATAASPWTMDVARESAGLVRRGVPRRSRRGRTRFRTGSALVRAAARRGQRSRARATRSCSSISRTIRPARPAPRSTTTSASAPAGMSGSDRASAISSTAPAVRTTPMDRSGVVSGAVDGFAGSSGSGFVGRSEFGS